MQTIRVGQLIPGMILAQDVLIPRTGVTLLPMNTVLTMEMIRRISSFHIDEVYIKEPERSDKEKNEEILVPVMASHEKSVAALKESLRTFARIALRKKPSMVWLVIC